LNKRGEIEALPAYPPVLVILTKHEPLAPPLLVEQVMYKVEQLPLPRFSK
jgi:hypothetical protein